MLPLLLLLLLGSHSAAAAATAEGDAIISAFAELPSGSTSFYLVLHSGENCTNSTSLKGFLPGNSTRYHPAADTDNTCTESSVCAVLFDSKDDSRCPVEASTTGEVRGDDGDVYMYSPFRQSFVASQCLAGTWYPGCPSFEYYSLGALTSDPNLLANSNPADLEGMGDFIYYVYYEDDQCTEPASIWSSMDRESVTVDIVSNYTEYSCAVRSACAIDPSSPLCEALRDGPDHTATFVSITELDESTGEQNVYDCDTSNVEVGQEQCSVISPRDCIASSLIPGCHLRFFSGPTLSKYPRVLIGDMAGLPAVEGESSAAQMSLAYGFYAFLGICWSFLF